MRRKPLDQEYTRWAGPSGSSLPEPRPPSPVTDRQRTEAVIHDFVTENGAGASASAGVARAKALVSAMPKTFRRVTFAISTPLEPSKELALPSVQATLDPGCSPLPNGSANYRPVEQQKIIQSPTRSSSRSACSHGSWFRRVRSFSGKPGCVRSSAWIWLFSSTERTTACAGGSTSSPTTSRSLSTNSGSLESLNCRTRCGACRG